MKAFNIILIITSSIVILVNANSCTDNRIKNLGIDSTDSLGLTQNSETTKVIDSNLYFKGESIFKTDCNTCHVGKNRGHYYIDRLVNWVGEDYFKLYVTKQDSLIHVKDSIAILVKKSWNNHPYNHNFAYSEQDLEALIEYVK